MAVLTSLSDDDLRAICANYSLGQLVRSRGILAGSVNSNFALDLTSGSYFLRLYEEQTADGARAEARLLEHLASRGVATPAPIARSDGQLIGEARGKPAAIFPWRAGEMRCQRAVTAGDCREVGAALARVHRAGEGAERSPGRFGVRDLFARVALIERASDPALAAEAPGLRDALDNWVSRRDPQLPQGVVHGDLFRDNVLWTREGTIAALLDFESASEGVLAYDLMVTALAWCTGDALDGALVRAMVAGYESVRPLTARERDGLLAEACVAALRFTITRITDYAMRKTETPRVLKDWRRFKMRFDALEAMGDSGLRALIG